MYVVDRWTMTVESKGNLEKIMQNAESQSFQIWKLGLAGENGHTSAMESECQFLSVAPECIRVPISV
jgi:hypothetical protein